MIALKHIHLTLAVLSIVLFLIRFFGREMGAAFVQAKFLRIAPHIINTALLGCGIALVLGLGYSLWPFNWLSLKLLLVAAYIVMGVVAFKHATTGVRRVAALLAVASFITAAMLGVSKPF